MDKTIEVILVAVVVIATAAIMLFIVTGESGDFSDFISEQRSDSACELAQQRCDLDYFEDEDTDCEGFTPPSELERCDDDNQHG